MAEAFDPARIAAAVVADLLAVPARCALVGGLAVMAHGRARFTKDVDFVVEVATDAAAERLVHALVAVGYRVGSVLEQRANGRMATVRLFRPGAATDEPDCDLLFATCGIEAEVVRNARTILLDTGDAVPIASRAHLVAMKLLSERPGRPNDRADLHALLTVVTAKELAEVKSCLELITARGYSRGKDLRAALLERLADIGRAEVGAG